VAGGDVWDFLANFLKIMQVGGVGADDVKEVWEIVEHLFANRQISKDARRPPAVSAR